MNITLTLLLIFVPVILIGQIKDNEVDFNYKIKRFDDLIIFQNKNNLNSKIDSGIIEIDTVYSCNFDSLKRVHSEYIEDREDKKSIVYSYNSKGFVDSKIEYCEKYNNGFIIEIIKNKFEYNEIDSVKKISQFLYFRKIKDSVVERPDEFVTETRDSMVNTIICIFDYQIDDYSNEWNSVENTIVFEYDSNGNKIRRSENCIEPINTSPTEWKYKYNEQNKIIQETEIIKLWWPDEKDFSVYSTNESYFKYNENYIERIDTMKMTEENIIANSKISFDNDGKTIQSTYQSGYFSGDRRETYNIEICDYEYFPGTNKLSKVTESEIDKDNGKCKSIVISDYEYVPGTNKLFKITATKMDKDNGKFEVISERNYHYK